jgi:hypothetical protein
VIGAAALAAVLVLATQGGASGSNASAFGPGGAPGGNSAPGPSGGTGSNGSGSSGGSGNSAPGEQFGMPGSGGGNSGDDQDSSSRAQRRAQIQAFEACLQRNGVDLSSLRSSGRPRFDPSDPAMAKAFQACASLLPHRSDRDGDGPHFGGRGDQSPGTNQEQGGGTAVPGRTT